MKTVSIALVIVSFAHGESITLQPGPEGKDAYIDYSNPSAN